MARFPHKTHREALGFHLESLFFLHYREKIQSIQSVIQEEGAGKKRNWKEYQCCDKSVEEASKMFLGGLES